MMITAQWLTATDKNSITDQELEKVVKATAEKVDETQINNIDKAITGVKTNGKTIDVEDRVWNLYADYIEALEDAGFIDLPNSHPHIAIRHIYNRIEPMEIKTRMKCIARVRKDKKFDEKDFGEYIRELASQSRRMDQEGLLNLNTPAAKITHAKDNSREHRGNSKHQMATNTNIGRRRKKWYARTIKKRKLLGRKLIKCSRSVSIKVARNGIGCWIVKTLANKRRKP